MRSQEIRSNLRRALGSVEETHENMEDKDDER